MRHLTSARTRQWCRCASLVVALCASSAAHAAGQNFTALFGGSGQDYANCVTTDAAGNIYIGGETYSADLHITAGALQAKAGGSADGFVAKFGPDGTLIWSTYLGGLQDDAVTSIAVDAGGNVIVAGWTRSANFPLFHAVQSVLDNNSLLDNFDAFVTKIDPAGTKLLYSTFLGGPADDLGYGLALDSAGNAYVTGSVQEAAGFTGFAGTAAGFGIFVSKLDPQGALVYSFFHPKGSFAGIAAAGAIVVDSSGSAYVAGTNSSSFPATVTKSFGPSGASQAMVFKVSADGTTKIFETTLGGSVYASAMGVALDKSGAVYLAGLTASVDFPTVNPFQSTPGLRPLWKSADGGATFTPFDNLPFALPQAIVVDPTAPKTIYVATADLGIFKSLDGGVTWTPMNHGIASLNPQILVMDPQHPQTLYAATAPSNSAGASALYKTTDGGNNWSLIDSPSGQLVELVVDAQNSNLIYELSSVLRKSVDGGVTWSAVAFPGTHITYFALDPHASGTIVAYSALFFGGIFSNNNVPPFIWRSTDGGATWTQPPAAPSPGSSLLVDGSTNPSSFYNGLTSRSVDGGLTWTPLPPSPASGGTAAIDAGGTLYASVYQSGIYVSRDHGQTWTPAGSPANAVPVGSLVAPGSSGTLYGTYGVNSQNGQTSGFVTKLSPDGQTILFSTYLRGHVALTSAATTISQAGVFLTQNWISGIAVDAQGNIAVAGGTRSADFPVVKATQTANAGGTDAYIASLSPDGSQLNYATYLGGSGDDGALALTLDGQGDIIVAGQTKSNDFPVSGGAQSAAGTFGDAFIAKLSPGAPIITSVVNGANYQPGIEAGSWVTIKGNYLANTNPGRTWRPDEVVNGALPTSLDGVSVTIDGKAAFVYYISPTQINVQAPADATAGTVNVVVTNNGVSSGAAQVQLQAAAPAFFQFGSTYYAVASRLPDYQLLADPGAVAGTVPAKPGDIVVLWGTGFGATTPSVPAGQVVTGLPAAPLPTVTLGGVAARVINSILTAGTAGLYQVTIQIPNSVPTGPVVVQASIGTVSSWAGTLMFISQ
jgi:uncharacterized protein (TIGR03437 family)